MVKEFCNDRIERTEMIASKEHHRCTEGAYGALYTDRAQYQPLDRVRVRIHGRDSGDTRCRIRVHDSEQVPYFEAEAPLRDNRGEVCFTAAGAAGAQYVYLDWPEPSRSHSRYCNFRVDPETSVESADKDFDLIFPFTREKMRLGRREYRTEKGRMIGYISADTWHFDGIWLRDWIYGLPAFRHWETDMTRGIDRFLERQSPDGMIPDGIERNGKTWRVGLESDVEYIMTLAVYQAWQASGDDEWLAAALPKLELALDYIRRDPRHWDETHRLVKRQHSCDTWDFDIDGAGDRGAARHVIATCDQSGYVLAFRAMSEMQDRLGHKREARRWSDYAEAYRRRAGELLWDGVKFRHHVHLDPIDHGDFDESGQLAMGNTWAMTRGLATPEQARSILDEYRRRWISTGDAHPWWSLQPGYPDHLGYFAKKEFCAQGGYANGGLMPWVGGELCRAAFFFGREAFGVELLRDYAEHLRRTGGAQVWYWPDGAPGFRTPNEVPYAGWGMAQWVEALLEGLAGIRPRSDRMRHLLVAPCWAAAEIDTVRVTSAHPASGAYFAYRMRRVPETKALEIDYCGSGRTAEFRVPWPAGPAPERVEHNGRPIEWRMESLENARYVLCSTEIDGLGRLRIV